MVVHESFVTRKPLEFTLIVLSVILLLLLPVYFLTKSSRSGGTQETDIVPQTYDEVQYLFGQESDLSDSDKRHLFNLQYENNFVQWTGNIIACDDINGLHKVSIDHSGDGFGDVIFTTYNDCADVPMGSTVTYKTKLIDWKILTFVGKDGEILKWE